jgi:hypothetical protein
MPFLDCLEATKRIREFEVTKPPKTDLLARSPNGGCIPSLLCQPRWWSGNTSHLADLVSAEEVGREKASAL